VTPYYQKDGVTLYHAHMADVPLQWGSADAVITDPPYPREYSSVWNHLGTLSSRTLKRGGSLLSIVPHYLLPDVLHEMTFHEGLKYRWICAMWQHGGAHPRMAMGIEVTWKPVVWWVKDAWPQGRGYRIDGFKNNQYPKEKRRPKLHKWEQSMDWAEYCLKFVPPRRTVLECSYDKRHALTTGPMRDMQRTIPVSGQGQSRTATLLQSDVRERGAPPAREDVPMVREPVHPDQVSQVVLQPDMRQPMDVEEPVISDRSSGHSERLRPTPSSRSSAVYEGGLHHGASTGGRGDARETAARHRGGPSSERVQGGQQVGEPPSVGEAATRSRQAHEQDRDMPTLHTGVPTRRQCPVCRAPLVERDNGPSVIVDPMMGSGTLVVAARDQGFTVVGVDNDEAACETTVRRLEGSVS
jgi:hypothetical protein